MSKVISILKDLGRATVKPLLTIVALVMLVALVILIALAIPVCIVLLIIDAVATFLEAVVVIIERKYEEHKRSDSADMCEQESAEDSASDSDDARDTAGTESTGSDDEF